MTDENEQIFSYEFLTCYLIRAWYQVGHSQETFGGKMIVGAIRGDHW